MMEIETTRIFVKVLQLGSFTKAATALKIPKSTVSRAVARLEKESGTKLLIRTTRQITATAAGRAFYENCVAPIQTLEDARKSLQGRDSLVMGHIRITAPEDIGEKIVSTEIAKLSRKHKGLTFELNYTDTIVDLIADGVDCAIRIGKLRVNRLKAIRLGHIVLIAVASPEYVKKNKPIKKPQDLLEHDCLSYTITNWILKSKKSSHKITVKPRIVSNQITGLIKLALSGAGVTYVPSYLCQEELKSGKLVQVLPEWTGVPYPVHLVLPLSAQSSMRMKIVSEQLKESISQLLKN